jgi:hypothetical protein
MEAVLFGANRAPSECNAALTEAVILEQIVLPQNLRSELTRQPTENQQRNKLSQ